MLDPSQPDACLYFGRTLYLLDRFEQAVNVLRAEVQRHPENAEAYRIEALALEGWGKADEAEAAFQLAIRRAKNPLPNEDPAIDYGVFLYRQGRAEAAVSPLEAAIVRHPDASRAHLELGCVLLSLDRNAAAAPQLERATTLDPRSARAHLLLAKAYQRLGKTEAARQELDQGSRIVK